MATNNPKIRYDIEAAVSGGSDVNALANQLDGLANTLEGDLKMQALASAQALRELGAKQGAIDNFVKLKGEAGGAAARLKEAQAAAQQLGQQLSASGAPTRAQTGQMEKLRDAVRTAKTELQDKTRALDNSRATLSAYGVSSNNVAQAERTTRQAVAQAREEVARLAPAYTAAASAATASGQRQTKSAQEVKASLAGVGDTLRSIQNIALTAVGGTFLTSMARDVGAVADQYNNLRARIQLVAGDGPALEAAFEAVRQVALGTNTSLESTVQLFTRVAQAGKEVGISQQQALQVTETINKAIQSGGGSAAAAEAAITQFIQGLQSGVLRGEEFNSVMENGYPIAQLLAQSLGVTTGELRKMANEGKLTTGVILGAMLEQKDAVDAAFNQLPQTIGRALQNLSTNWTTFIGQLDQSTGASQAAASAIGAVASNLDEIAAMATRAGAVMAAALAIQAAGAVRAYMAEVTLATGATKLLALQMSALPKTLQIAVAFTGFEVGYQIGEMLRDNSEYARKLGVATVAFIQGNVEVLRLLKDSAAAVFTSDTIEAAYQRFNARLAQTKATLEQMWADAARAPEPAAKAADAVAAATARVGVEAEKAADKVRVSNADIVQAWEAAAIAKRGDAQAAEANLRVQLQLVKQSEAMARYLGDERKVREAKIQQMQIEIQLAQARVAVMRAEAEGAIAVAQAKLAEMAASKNIDLVKQAELETSIKLAQAKLAEADATGQAAELLKRQLEDFKKGSAAADSYAGSIDGLADKQRRLAAETREASKETRGLMAWLDRLEKRNSEVKSTLVTDKDKFAVDGSGNRIVQTADNRSSTAQRLKSLGLDDATAERLAQSVYDDRGNFIGRSSGAYRDGDTLDALLQRLAAQQSGGAAIGRTVTVNLNVGEKSWQVRTDTEGADAIMQTLQAARLAAGG